MASSDDFLLDAGVYLLFLMCTIVVILPMTLRLCSVLMAVVRLVLEVVRAWTSSVVWLSRLLALRWMARTDMLRLLK